MEEKAPVISILAGRLGNCMFQIANGLNYARLHNRPFKIYYGDFQPADTQYSSILGRFERLTELPDNKIKVEEEEREDGYKNLVFPDDIAVMFEGYFQDEKYVDKNDVLEAFKTPEGLREKVFEKYGDISDCVSIHVRRGDFVGIGIALDADWYEDVYKEFFNGQRAFICSDDIEWCKENIKIENVIFANGETAVEDLYAASFCKNHIADNGSFGWWTAYLGQRKDTVVVVKEGVIKSFPKNWIKR